MGESLWTWPQLLPTTALCMALTIHTLWRGEWTLEKVRAMFKHTQPASGRSGVPHNKLWAASLCQWTGSQIWCTALFGVYPMTWVSWYYLKSDPNWAARALPEWGLEAVVSPGLTQTAAFLLPPAWLCWPWSDLVLHCVSSLPSVWSCHLYNCIWSPWFYYCSAAEWIYSRSYG